MKESSAFVLEAYIIFLIVLILKNVSESQLIYENNKKNIFFLDIISNRLRCCLTLHWLQEEVFQNF